MNGRPGHPSVVLNGAAHEHHGQGTIRSLVDEVAEKPEQVAVVLNEHVVPRARWGSTGIHDGDRIELVTFAGGG